VEAGEVVVAKGEVPPGMLLMMHGSMAVVAQGGLRVQRYVNGDHLLHSEAVNGLPLAAPLVAEEAGLLYVVPPQLVSELQSELSLERDLSAPVCLRSRRVVAAPDGCAGLPLQAHGFGFPFHASVIRQKVSAGSAFHRGGELAVCSGYHPEPNRKRRVPKACQDHAVLREELAPGVALAAVFDGHGANGAAVAQRLGCSVPQLLAASCLFPHAPEAALMEAFVRAEAELAADPEVDVRRSGSTAVVALLGTGGSLVVGWAGDSRAVLASRGAAGAFVTTELTWDHKPDTPGERQRLEGLGAVCCQGDPRSDGPPDTTLPFRVWNRADPLQGPGLSMSRSLGDTAATSLGCIPTPSVVHRQVQHGDEFVLLASDGLWEVFESAEACAWVASYVSARGDPFAHNSMPGHTEGSPHATASAALAQEAQRRWYQKFNATEIVDDVSVVIIPLGTAPASPLLVVVDVR